MGLLNAVMNAVMKIMSFKLTIGQFSFSMASVFIGLSLLSIAFWFLGKVFR